MKKFFRKVILWTYIKVHSLFLNLGMAMRDEALMNLDVDEKKKFNKRWIRSVLLQKFEQGQRDEKYVQDYYNLLRKSDKFMREVTPHKMAVVADKHGMNYGQKDKYGRRYEHLGFFDGKHKHSGKTMGEVLVEEFEERRTKDDEYELLNIISNKPTEVEFSKIFEVVEETPREGADFEYEMVDRFDVSKKFVFPIKIVREKDVLNKIEQLTESLHIKKIGFEHRQLEFFIPLKFKTSEHDENSDIFKELIDFQQVYINNDYGELIGYNIIEFSKRITHNETHDVFKFHAIQMQTIGF